MKDCEALIIDWGDAYQAATSSLELALEGAAVFGPWKAFIFPCAC